MSKLSAATMLPISAEAFHGDALSLGMSENPFPGYEKPQLLCSITPMLFLLLLFWKVEILIN